MLSRLIRERLVAQQEQRDPDFIALLRRWGGVTIAYRRTMQESPAYRRNPEELAKALEEGIYYAEGLEPKAVVLNQQGHVQALRCQWFVWDEEGQWVETDEEQVLPARSIFVATGARLNVAYEFEHRGTFLRHNSFEYKRFDWVNGDLVPVATTGHVKSAHFGAFTSYQHDNRHVSFLGDTHPIFHGSVVKAIASAQRVYPKICQALASRLTAGKEKEYQQFRANMDDCFQAKVVKMIRHNLRVVEIIVRAPLAAKNGGSGQFYRLQNYEGLAPIVKQTRLQMDGLAFIGVRHTFDKELLSFFVVEQGASSKLVRYLQPGEHVALMGPTGSLNSLPPVTTIMIIGGILSPAFLLSMREKILAGGYRVLYIAYLENPEDVYCQAELEALAEVIVWITRRGKITQHRPQDYSFEGDLVTCLQSYARAANDIRLNTVQYIWIIDSSCILHQIKQAKKSLLQSDWPAEAPISAAVYGPMQCMLKGVCAQCLQWQLDPVTGKRSKAVYACSWQHQPLDKIDIHHLDERLMQNRCQETLTNLWIDYLLT